jgi:pimeloyl-ACP methyl ester carboxylesterase
VSGIAAGMIETRPGSTIAWTVVGQGPPLLLLNGYAATGADWDPVFIGALAAPERVAALGLISTHTGGPDCVDADPAVWQRLIDHSGTPREQATRFLSLLFPADRAAEVDERFGEIVAAARAELPEPVLFMQEEAIVAWHGRPSALPPADPGIPTVVVHGGSDTVVPPANAEVLAGVHPGARVEILADCAHAPMAQEPEAVAAAILAVSRA